MKSKTKVCVVGQGFAGLPMSIAASNSRNNLGELNFKVIEHSFPDHYDFMEEDLNFEENLPIVMTEKDAIRSEDLNHLDFWYLRIKVSPPENLLDRILDKIKDK